MKKVNISQEQILDILNVCYEKAVQGIPGSDNCFDLANQYLCKYETPDQAAKEFIKLQIAKCTTSGFVTSLGGVITMPVTIPTNLLSVWYVQMRMLATLAVMSGEDPLNDSVQTLVYVCLTGSSLSKICKDAGVQFANKFTMAMIKKIPGTVLTKINQAVGFRFITKLGTSGIVNLGKMIPLAGGLVGGTFDYVGTKTIAKQGYKTFMLKEVD